MLPNLQCDQVARFNICPIIAIKISHLAIGKFCQTQKP